MKTLYEVVRPLMWVMTFYGVPLDLRKRQHVFIKLLQILLVICWRALDCYVLYIAWTNGIYHAYERFRRTKSGMAYVIRMLLMYINGLLPAILRLVMFKKVCFTDHSQVFKEFQVSSNEAVKMKRKVTFVMVLFVFSCICVIGQVIQLEIVRRTENVDAETVIKRIGVLIIEMSIYFVGPSCAFLIVASDCVSGKLDKMKTTLKRCKSPLKSLITANRMINEYERLTKFSTQCDHLFSLMVAFILLANTLCMSTFAETYNQLHLTFKYFKATPELIWKVTFNLIEMATQNIPFLITVVYVKHSITANDKKRRFIGQIIALQLEDKDMLPFELSGHRIDQLCWTFNRMIDGETDWFTLGCGLTCDLDLAFGLVQLSVNLLTSVSQKAKE